jgi:NADPH-dependent curcumin reductase CurA
MIQNKAFIYKQIPDAFPVAGQHVAVEDIGFGECAPPPKNGFTTQNLYATFDPTQRSSMRDPKIQSYSAAFEIGNPLVSISVIGKVLKSNNSKFREGTIVLLELCGTESFSVVSEISAERARVLEPQKGIALTAYLGALGLTGSPRSSNRYARMG